MHRWLVILILPFFCGCFIKRNEQSFHIKFNTPYDLIQLDIGGKNVQTFNGIDDRYSSRGHL